MASKKVNQAPTMQNEAEIAVPEKEVAVEVKETEKTIHEQVVSGESVALNPREATSIINGNRIIFLGKGATEVILKVRE